MTIQDNDSYGQLGFLVDTVTVKESDKVRPRLQSLT